MDNRTRGGGGNSTALNNVQLNQFHYGFVSLRWFRNWNSWSFFLLHLDNLLQIGFAARSVGLQSLERVYWEIFQITTLSYGKQSTFLVSECKVKQIYLATELQRKLKILAPCSGMIRFLSSILYLGLALHPSIYLTSHSLQPIPFHACTVSQSFNNISSVAAIASAQKSSHSKRMGKRPYLNNRDLDRWTDR